MALAILSISSLFFASSASASAEPQYPNANVESLPNAPQASLSDKRLSRQWRTAVSRWSLFTPVWAVRPLPRKRWQRHPAPVLEQLGGAEPLEMMPGDLYLLHHLAAHASLGKPSESDVRISLDLRFQAPGVPTGRFAIPCLLASNRKRVRANVI